MKRCLYCYFITFHFLIACVDKDDTSINLTIENDISKYDDDTYVNLVVDIKCFDQKYYIVDGEYNSLYILDDDFELIESIGNSGRGPDEFISMCNVLVDKNGFYLSDYRGNFILKYNHSIKDKVPERRINLPDNIRRFFRIKFDKNNEDSFFFNKT